MTSLVVVGDTLADRDVNGTVERLCPDAPVPVVDEQWVTLRPGGAGLAAALAAADGLHVTLVSALARDAAGEELRAALRSRGVDLVDLGCDGATAEKVRVLCAGRSLLRLDRGGQGAIGSLCAQGRAAIAGADGVLVADYGRGVAASPSVRDALAARVAAGGVVVWDPHPRGAGPVAGVDLATPNAGEASGFAGSGPVGDVGGLDAAGCASRLATAWECRWVCVTRGAHGAVLAGRLGGSPMTFAAPRVHGGDPCGAGDRFAVSAAAGLARGLPIPTAVGAAVEAASAFVAAGGAGAPPPGREPGTVGGAPGSRVTPARNGTGGSAERDANRHAAFALADRVRARGGTLVATGGCFDILHPGHVQTLRAARALGDALVVCLNGDASVRRLKGPDRPLVGEEDRAEVVGALGCVDAVAIFDEDTPAQLLDRLRPHVWAKGGDYADRPLPESDVLAAWGGRTVILPFVDGRSSTRLIEEVALHGTSG